MIIYRWQYNKNQLNNFIRKLQYWLRAKMQQDLTPKEKHDIWIKNSGYLYERLVVHKQKWPSLTFDWLPTIIQTQQSTIYEFVIGTHTSKRRAEEFLYIMQVQLPFLKNIEDPQPQIKPSVVTQIQKFRHQSQINRARHCPANPNLIAARVDNAPLTIFKRGNEYPQKILTSHTFQSGFGLDWNPYNLIVGDYNGTAVIWNDIDQEKEANIIKTGGTINDIRTVNHSIFMTVGDEGIMGLWDTRSGKEEGKIPVSQQQLYALDINPQNRNLILTGGEDTIVRLWDTRKYDEKLYKFDGHTDKVLNVRWSQKNPTIFASGSQDTKVKIWDLLRIGFEIPKDHSGTQELLFTHEGHQGQILDISWHPHCMLLGSSEQEFNNIQIYEIANCIQDLEYAEDIEFLQEQCLV